MNYIFWNSKATFWQKRRRNFDVYNNMQKLRRWIWIFGTILWNKKEKKKNKNNNINKEEESDNNNINNKEEKSNSKKNKVSVESTIKEVKEVLKDFEDPWNNLTELRQLESPITGFLDEHQESIRHLIEELEKQQSSQSNLKNSNHIINENDLSNSMNFDDELKKEKIN